MLLLSLLLLLRMHPGSPYTPQWPNSGEIDIVDHKDTSTSVSHGIQLSEYGQHTWHVQEAPLSDTSLDWHVYKLEWNCDYLRWYVDGQKTFGVSRFDVSEWPFDQPFYLAATYNVGGDLVDKDVALINSQLLIDYVRVYPANVPAPTTNTAKTVAAVNATSVLLGNSTSDAMAANLTSSDSSTNATLPSQPDVSATSNTTTTTSG